MNKLNLGLALFLFLPGAASAQLETSEETLVDVSAGAFSAIWQASEAATPSITIYADAAGNTDITDQFQVVLWPQRGTPNAGDAYSDRIATRERQLASQNLGVMSLKVTGLTPDTIYYYQLHTTTSGESSVHPSTLPASLRTAPHTPFVEKARQLAITVNYPDSQGWWVTGSATNTLSPVLGKVGDGGEEDEVWLDLSNLLASDGSAWSPDGDVPFTLRLMGAYGEVFEHEITLNTPNAFAVTSTVSIVVDPILDADGDGLVDEDDNCPTVSNADQSDIDGDGLGDVCDADADGDGIANGEDTDPLDSGSCQDLDGDLCDDCSFGTSNVNNDGLDTDNDGLCDVGDFDDDNDGVTDDIDGEPTNPNSCQDSDSDFCDDCSISGFVDVSNDGLDTDSDGVCDLGDTDDDGDGVADVMDTHPLDSSQCQDLDSDQCDDCFSGTADAFNDGPDADGDGICDVSDAEECDGQDNDGDGLVDEGFETDDDFDGIPDCLEDTLIPGEVHGVSINESWSQIAFAEGYLNPVMIVGPATSQGEGTGVIRLDGVDSASADIQFQNWDYLPDSHGPEDVDILVLESGQYNLPDGVLVEVGTLQVDNTANYAWKNLVFETAFSSTPHLFLSTQTYSGGQAVTARARNLDEVGVQVGLFEQESLMDGHYVETVAYVAISAPNEGGTLNIGQNELAYTLQTLALGSDWHQPEDQAFHLEEEASEDAETTHINEEVSFLTLSGHVFLQDVSTFGSDPALIRRYVADADEDGLVDVIDPENNTDSDGDGMPDEWENLYADLDPMDPNDANSDPDGDGLSNLEEYLAGTAPDEADSDGDGMVDGIDSDPVDGAAIGVEVSHGMADGDWQNMPFLSSFEDPIVIVGPPSSDDEGTGVLRLAGVGPEGFDVQFQEWDSLDGVHANEDFSYSVWEKRRYTTPEGTVIEAGTFLLSGTDDWSYIPFSSEFDTPPSVFLTVQTDNGGQAIAVRANLVGSDGFEAALFEEEALMDGHLEETVAYLAILGQGATGTLSMGHTDLPWVTQEVWVNNVFSPQLSGAVAVKEEASEDAEVNHVDELVAVLNLGDELFAQQVSDYGSDPASLRKELPPLDGGGEWGWVSGVGSDGLIIPLAESFTDPVVLVNAVDPSHGGVARVTLLGSDQFRVHFDDWTGQGIGVSDVFYLVVEAGEGVFAGLNYQAGRIDSNGVLDSTDLGMGWSPVALTQSFLDSPVVMTTLESHVDDGPLALRVNAMSTDGFDIAIQEAEGADGFHGAESIAWLAVEPGLGATDDGRPVGVMTLVANSVPLALDYGPITDRRHGIVLSSVNSIMDPDPISITMEGPDMDSVTLALDEEKTGDPETTHGNENLGVIVIE